MYHTSYSYWKSIPVSSDSMTQVAQVWPQPFWSFSLASFLRHDFYWTVWINGKLPSNLSTVHLHKLLFACVNQFDKFPTQFCRFKLQYVPIVIMYPITSWFCRNSLSLLLRDVHKEGFLPYEVLSVKTCLYDLLVYCKTIWLNTFDTLRRLHTNFLYRISEIVWAANLCDL